ncbi:MAG: hypothetical protein H6737_14615 [Alphaproteobacteria bacterium]|nr:hypothetical protein [Alphaproteobacteria bacterium]
MRFVGLLALGALVGCQEYALQGRGPGPELEPDAPDAPDAPVPAPQPGPDAVPPAEAPVYANTSDSLYEVDPISGARALVGQFRTPDGAVVGEMTDIAIDHQGRVYGGTYDALYQIDPATAAVTRLCDTQVEMVGMAFTPDGHLLAAGDTVIQRLDPATCAAAPVLSGTPYNTSGDLVGLPDGYLYWTVWGDDETDGLVRIDPQTWELAYLGDIPVARLFGLGYADGQLFGFSDTGETVAVEPGYGGAGGWVATEVLSDDPSVGWWGATTNPVAW